MKFLKALSIPESPMVFTPLFHIYAGKEVKKQSRLLEGTLKISLLFFFFFPSEASLF